MLKEVAGTIGRWSVDAHREIASLNALRERISLAYLGLNPFGCGRTGRGYAFHDHDVPRHQKLDSSQQAKVWVFDKAKRKFIPYDHKLHGKFEELNLPVGETVARAPHTNGTRAVYRHDGDKHFGTIEFKEEKNLTIQKTV